MAAWAHITPYLELLTQTSTTNCSTLSLGNWKLLRIYDEHFVLSEERMNKDNYVTRQKNRKTGKVPKFGRRGLGFGKQMKLERESRFFLLFFHLGLTFPRSLIFRA